MTPLQQYIDSTARTVMSQKTMYFPFARSAQGSRKTAIEGTNEMPNGHLSVVGGFRFRAQ
jgi:hypothetical protein